MKKIFLLACIMVLIALPLASGALEGANLDIVLAGQSPIPVEPGSNAEIDIQINNNGLGEAEEIIVEVKPAYPFTLITGDRVKKFASINPSSTVKSSYVFLVDDSAVTNTYEIEFLVYSNKTPIATMSKKLPVSVMGSPKLILTDLDISPLEIEPGSMVDISARIKNVGTGRVSYMEVRLNSSSSYLVPVLSKGSAYIGDLGPGEEARMDFQISIDISADYKTYMTSLTTGYRDESNVERQTVFDIGIPVSGAINLDVIDMEASLERGRLRIEVANKGTSEAKSLEARLVIGGETIGIDYLTSLKPNKQTTFDFPLVYTGSGQLIIDYIGPGIEKNQAIEEISLSFAEPGGANGSGLAAGAVVLVIIIIVVYYFFFRKRKKK